MDHNLEADQKPISARKPELPEAFTDYMTLL